MVDNVITMLQATDLLTKHVYQLTKRVMIREVDYDGRGTLVS